MARVWKIHQVYIWYFVLGTILLAITDGSLVSECNERCSSSVAVISTDTNCDMPCRNSSCITGCSSWDNSTLLECHAVCNTTYSTEPQRVQYCQSGCLFAEDEYASAVEAEVGQPSAPEPSDIGSTSLTLNWDAASNNALNYLVEWRYTDGNSNAWSYYGSGEPFSENSLAVTGLIPYASYRFRVVWVITPRHTLTSPATNTIQTMESGAPSTSPTIISITSSSPMSISLTWAPPRFSNGPLIGYTVAVRNFLNQPAVKRSHNPAATQTTVVDASFQASMIYAVSISASNMAGEGPSDTVNVTTAEELNVTGIVPYLVVGVTSLDFNVLQEASIVSFVEFDQLSGSGAPQQNDIHTVDNENSNIQDVAVHYAKNMVFISDSDGSIHRRIIDPANLTIAPSEVLYTNQSPPPSKLAVDWLNDQLYFVQGGEIHRCDLNGSGCEVAVSNLDSTPVEVKVDPFIGYLFWSQTDAGIYRLPITMTTTDAANAAFILPLEHSSSFTVISESFEIVYSNSSGDSLHGAFIDGSARRTLRSTDDSSVHKFINTTSVVYFNRTVTWTHAGVGSNQTCLANYYSYIDGDVLYHEMQDGSAPNQADLFLCVAGFHGLDVFHPATQPFPVPAFPPTDLQVIFTDDVADITWTRPLSLPGKGAGAWEEWLYEVTLTDQAMGTSRVLSGIVDVGTVAEGLNASSEYSVHVRAYSAGGLGPESEAFSGTTLMEVDVPPYLLLANESKLWTAELNGKSEAEILALSSAVKDIDWYPGYYVWSTMSGSLYRAGDTSGTADELVVQSQASVVGAIAVDWIGGFLYWADTDQSQILRGQLSAPPTNIITSPSIVNSFAREVQDLALDSVQAYLYWTTSSSVRCSRLNGESPLEFYRTAELSLDVVAGLTLDLDGGFVYWFLVSRQNAQEELRLYRAGLAGASPDPVSTVEEIGDVLSETTSLALHFYSSKLFWIDSESRVVVSDNRGQRQAILPTSSDVQTLTIVQETLRPLPVGYNATPNVVAEEIPLSSVQVVGTWDDFNITWPASTAVSYGIVFYTIAVDAGSGQAYEETVEEAYFRIQDLAPFQSLAVSIRPYTYWATTPDTTTQLTSPMSVPSVPLNPRAFSIEQNDIMLGTTEYSAEFRWDSPTEINGILGGYYISWGAAGTELTSIQINQSDVTFSYTFSNLTSNTTYVFQVEGFTSVGRGPTTEAVSITTGVSAPPPILAVSTSTGIAITDSDTGEETPLLGGNLAVSVVAFVAIDDRVYFIEATGDPEIYVSNLDGSSKSEIGELNSVRPTQASFVIDWVSQVLYWSDASAIFSFDTTLPDTMATIETIYMPTVSVVIGGITVNPHGGSLLWSESTQTTSTLMTSDLDGQNPTPLFGSPTLRRRRAPENCTYPDDLTPGGAIYLDSSDPTDPALYFTDSASNDLWVCFLEQCQCSLLLDSSEPNSGLPPDSLSADVSRVYWSNAAAEIVASVDKTGADFQAQTGQTDVSFVLAYGTSLQPYPAPECLAPPDYSQPTQLASSDSEELTLTLDPIPECTGVSTATPIYTLHYSQVESGDSALNCSTDNLTCIEEETTALMVPLSGLEPYTFYLTQVSVRNLYSMGSPALGPVAVHRTGPGVPSEAFGVMVSVMYPTEALVSWSKPLAVNGPEADLRFRVLYQKESQDSRTSYSETVPDGAGGYSVLIDSLTEATQYTFSVESYQSSLPEDQYSLSLGVMETTFQTPAEVELFQVSSSSLQVGWMAPGDNSSSFHWIQYKEQSGDSDWEVALAGTTTAGEQYNVTIGDGITSPLSPYTDYQVRTVVRYVSGQEYEYTGDEDVLAVQTLASGPEAPGVPQVTETGTDPVTYVVQWTEPRANGPEPLVYTLDARAAVTGEWLLELYQGEETSWIVVDLPTGDTYTFRVMASNQLYDGPYSPISAGTFLPNPASDSTVFIIIGVVVGLLVIVAIIIIVLVCCHRRSGGSKFPQFQEDVELAQLRNYPNMAIRQENSNYAVTHDGKEVLLPIFPRERLKLITFLGSGAFGEVFEGNALDIMGMASGECRVAVKTLRKGATDQEKQEFLKEATIMGKFKHPNIVSLMGVCLDNDPQYIILELMEGGDLLSYIRAARAPDSEGGSLITLVDQVEIVLDVAKGCEHLEELHFVHRDLAARNCLVSTKLYDSHFRVVKIGDFGLARDIYKNDYYRKEGEGLLPVRWMSPEGLMDGYFSVQSDVWAFGILMWEVMSRGQQPYPARSNVEVLRYVEAGGRLNQPDKCPDDMYMLMRRCWERSPEDRPSFKMVREMISEFKRKSIGPKGADNFGYEGDGKVNYSHVKDIPPEMMDYLMPMDSKGDIKKKPVGIELPPDIDYDQADQTLEDDLKKGKNLEVSRKVSRKGSRKAKSPFSSLRGRLPGGAGGGDAPTPRLEQALQDLANNRDRAREVDDERYLKYPVESLSKATGANMAPTSPTAAIAGATAAPDVDGMEGAVGYTPDSNGDAPNRTELANYAQPRKRHPNPFRANSMEELEGYDNLTFGAKGVSVTDYSNV